MKSFVEFSKSMVSNSSKKEGMIPVYSDLMTFNLVFKSFEGAKQDIAYCKRPKYDQNLAKMMKLEVNPLTNPQYDLCLLSPGNYYLPAHSKVRFSVFWKYDQALVLTNTVGEV